jgi:signal transduction histidine kinase
LSYSRKLLAPLTSRPIVKRFSDEYLKDIHASGTHLLCLIDDILDLSKIEAGRMELELTSFDLPQAIDNALTLVRERWPSGDRPAPICGGAPG